MALSKGPMLEELVRAYFSRQGFYVLRSVPFQYDKSDVTDIDVWFYMRQAASVRIRGIVDVKNKKSPKAFERVLWVKGLQMAINCDRAVIATTDTNPTLTKFSQSQKISVLSKSFLDRLEKKVETNDRLTLEEFIEQIQSYEAHKQDGDWLKILNDAKATLASIGGFSAFNKAMLTFRFFATRAESKIQHREIALRCALFAAGLSCIALDSALEQFIYDDADRRFTGLISGVTYGEVGDGRFKENIDVALSALLDGMANGKVIAAQASHNLNRKLENVRADIIAEYFVREHNAQHLYSSAREFDSLAFNKSTIKSEHLSIEARSILGVFADFVGVSRSVLPIASTSSTSTLQLKNINKSVLDKEDKNQPGLFNEDT
ncbi:TPA: hypothetical protein ACX4EX_001730 [Yersinia enterocolitica]|uniref:hypothetical protein n=1 Tax=Yersinia enterocolitica TaxID=630 RepID=UPI0005FCE9D7|nr:hypothetical protein [Yersinia enterocolitica]EKN5933454.1 hypothetical protein [Yersinia enterocolitica]ELX2273960.1 hypothetical protein [Yersinia enterocolitica]ELY5259470.1 hypothetical protein [Yersinia enterocolitica]UXD24694.1 hypothetical protein FORC065_1845 [Yersinia enterocolitica]CRE88312.1 Uncharacterised protein [Yersinia enterocolitica]